MGRTGFDGKSLNESVLSRPSLCPLYPQAPCGNHPGSSKLFSLWSQDGSQEVQPHSRISNQAAEERPLGSPKSPSEDLIWSQQLLLIISQSLNSSLQLEIVGMLIGLHLYMQQRIVCWGAPRLSPDLVICQEAHRTHHIVILMTYEFDLLYQNIQSKIRKGESVHE